LKQFDSAIVSSAPMYSPITTFFHVRATVVPPDSDVGRDTFLVLSPPPSLPSTGTCSLFVTKKPIERISAALKFLVAIDKLNI
jgi:hypothetical protein